MIEVPLKAGYLLTVTGNRSPWTSNDYNARPDCPECGAEMLEGYNVKDGKPECFWWCEEPECAKKRNEVSRIHRLERLNKEVEEEPEMILKKYGISEKYYKCSLDNFEGSTYVKAAKALIKSQDKSHVFTGNVGTGKTHLAVAIERELIKSGNTDVFFVSVPELLMELRETYSEDSVSDKFIIDYYSEVGFLVLDDLGSEKTSEFSIASLGLIIDRRSRGNKPTIVTTNLKLEDIDKELGSRIASRLADGHIWKFIGGDYRKRR